MTMEPCHLVNHLGSLTTAKGGDNPLASQRAAELIFGSPLLFEGGFMAAQQPGTKMTIISGSLRGRRCIHEADVLDKSVDSPVPVPAFRVQLVTEDGEPDRSVVAGCYSVKVGW